MSVVASITDFAKDHGSNQIDLTKPFLPRRMTALSYSSIYFELTPAQQLKYNQFVGLQVNELAMAFESVIVNYYPFLAQHGNFSAKLQKSMMQMVAEEIVHIGRGSRINVQVEPDLYSARRFYFLRVSSRLGKALTRFTSMQLYFAPALVFLACLLEERLLYYGSLFEAEREQIEPHFYEMYSQHSEDEVFHVNLNLLLLEKLWSEAGMFQRKLNGLLAKHLLHSCLLAPKVSGKKVLLEVIKYFPELESRKIALLKANDLLSSDDEFLRSRYSWTTNSRSFSFADKVPELGGLLRSLPGYSIRGAQGV